MTGADKDILRTLRFRADLGQTWAIPEPRGRAGLVVPTMMTSQTLQRLRAVNLSTLRRMADQNLIVVTESPDRPAYGYAKATVPGPCWQISLPAATGGAS